MHEFDLYTFDRPPEVADKFAWTQYYDLLQSSLHPTNFPQFSVASSFKSLL